MKLKNVLFFVLILALLLSACDPTPTPVPGAEPTLDPRVLNIPGPTQPAPVYGQPLPQPQGGALPVQGGALPPNWASNNGVINPPIAYPTWLLGQMVVRANGQPLALGETPVNCQTIGRVSKTRADVICGWVPNTGSQPQQAAPVVDTRPVIDPPGNHSRLERWLKLQNILPDPGRKTWSYYDGRPTCNLGDDPKTIYTPQGVEIVYCPSTIWAGAGLIGVLTLSPIPGDEVVAAGGVVAGLGLSSGQLTYVLIVGVPGMATVVSIFGPEIEAALLGTTPPGAQAWAPAAVAGPLEVLLPAEMGTGLVWSLNHGVPDQAKGGIGSESAAVITGFSCAIGGPCLGGSPNKGDGRSNGSITCKAGVVGNLVNFACIHRVGQYGHFIVIQANLVQGAQQGFRRLAETNMYYDPNSVWYQCAWIISHRTHNGHQTPSQDLWIKGEAATTRYNEIVAKYNLIYNVFEVPVPRLPWQ